MTSRALLHAKGWQVYSSLLLYPSVNADPVKRAATFEGDYENSYDLLDPLGDYRDTVL